MREKNWPDITSIEIEKYCKAHTSVPSEHLEKLDALSQTSSDPKMISGAYLGKYLSIISKMIHPEYILEIGTYTGYGALCLSEGLRNGGLLHTIEKNIVLKDYAKSIYEKAAVTDRIVCHFGDAKEIIPQIDCRFDLVYIDAAKRQYISYFELVYPKMESGGIIIADNVLWKGKVASEHDDKLGKGLHEFNTYIKQHQGVENIILPIDDGVNLIRKR